MPTRRFLALATVSVATLSFVAPAAADTAADACADAHLRPASQDRMPAFERAVRCLIDEVRVRRGRPALRHDDRLADAAARHALDMRRRNYFSHLTLGGVGPRERLRDAGYADPRNGWRYGEVLAWGAARRSTPAAIVHSWLQSPAHRDVILAPGFREIGVGATPGLPVRRDADGVTVAVDLGARGRG